MKGISRILLSFLIIVNTVYVLPRIESTWLQTIVAACLIAFVSIQTFLFLKESEKRRKN